MSKLFCGLASLTMLLTACSAGGTAWLPLQEDEPGLYRVSMQEVPPHKLLPGPLYAQRLYDGQRHLLYHEEGHGDGSWLDDLPPGAYRSADGALILVRAGDSAADHVWSMVGMPVVATANGHQRAQAVHSGQGYDALSLLIHAWRLADEQPWPWVNHFGTFGGLGNYMTRLNGQVGLQFDQQRGCYIDEQGRPVRIGGDSAQPGVSLVLGDVVSADSDQEVATLAVLVADRGQLGVLDPEDVVVTTQQLGGAADWQVRHDMLGLLLGQRPIHAFRRDGDRLQQHLQQRLDGSNPVWQMESHRVWMLIAGMVVIILSLLRWGRRMRRRHL